MLKSHFDMKDLGEANFILGMKITKTYCEAQMIYGPGPSTQGESKGPSRGGLWPKSNKIAFGYRRG